MTLAASEKSVHSGAPIELYDIDLNGGDVAAYYLTDYYDDVTELSHTYSSVPIERSAITLANPADMQPLMIKLPYNHEVARELAIALPPRAATLTLRRYHGDIADVGTFWTGPIRRARLNNRVLTLEIPHVIADAVQTEISTASYQSLCNHQLYDAQCGLNRASFQTNTTISAIDSTDPRIVTITSFGAATPADHVAGEIVRVSDGERRTITAVSGTQLTLLRAFRNLSVSDSVEVYEGCPHTMTACNSQFSNAINFGGWPYVQANDLFRRGYRGTRF